MAPNKIIVTISKDIEEIVPSFLENRAKDIGLLTKAIADKDVSSAQTIGHKMAGNAGAYGFHQLGEIGCKMEAAAKENNWDLIKELFVEMQNYLGSIEIKYE